MHKTQDSSAGSIRFSGLELKDRFETSLACEIWLDDACNARWATGNTMKLAAVMIQSIKNNDGRPLDVARLDTLCAMTRDDAAIALRQMRMFGLIADFRMEAGYLHASCRLSHSGQIRYLDMMQKFDLLDGLRHHRLPAAPQTAPARSVAPPIIVDAAPPAEPATAETNIVRFPQRQADRVNADVARGGSIA